MRRFVRPVAIQADVGAPWDNYDELRLSVLMHTGFSGIPYIYFSLDAGNQHILHQGVSTYWYQQGIRRTTNE